MYYSLDYLRRSPPRCVRGVASAVHDDIARRFEADVENARFSCFGIRCNCENDCGSLRAPVWRDGEVVLWGSPLKFNCPRCGCETQFFDEARDGYDAEIGAAEAVENEEFSTFSCPKCQGAVHHIGIAFGYNMWDVSPAEFKGHDEDFFDACLVYIRCVQCGTVTKPVVFECA